MSMSDLIAFGIYSCMILASGGLIGYQLHKSAAKEEPKTKKTRISNHDFGNLLEPVSPKDQRFAQFLENGLMDRTGSDEN